MIFTWINMCCCYYFILAWTYELLYEILFDKYLADFKILNIQYAETNCPIDLKLSGSNVQVNRSLYTDSRISHTFENFKL